MVQVVQINGSSYNDDRGQLNFYNTFDMTEIVRMYEISPKSTDIVRAWQAHQLEKKWFLCSLGEFIINLVKIDNFDKPSKNLKPERFFLQATKPTVLKVSEGYATGFKANMENSKLLVFSNYSLGESKQDDFRYSVDNWSANWY